MMRPMATISSMASLTTSAITVPKPLMMAQSSRKYSMNISIVLSFLSLKVSANRTKYQIYLSISEVKPNLDEIRVSHFIRDSKGFRCLSADFNAIFLPDGTTLCRLSIPHRCSFPSMQKLLYSDNQYYIKTENLNFRFYDNQIIRNSVFQQFSK